jgi:hypothetical protein
MVVSSAASAFEALVGSACGCLLSCYRARCCKPAWFTPVTEPVSPNAEPVMVLLNRDCAERSVRVGNGT